jgi:hypothetical protein
MEKGGGAQEQGKVMGQGLAPCSYIFPCILRPRPKTSMFFNGGAQIS